MGKSWENMVKSARNVGFHGKIMRKSTRVTRDESANGKFIELNDVILWNNVVTICHVLQFPLPF
jgi:hypothetical protein